MVIAPDAASAARTQRVSVDQEGSTGGYSEAQEARMRAALVVPRAPLPRSQRKYNRPKGMNHYQYFQQLGLIRP